MRLLLLILPLVLLSGSALASQDCVYGPYLRNLGNHVYVQETKLFCRDLPVAPAERSEKIRAARERVALCLQMGGAQAACNALIDRDDPDFRAVFEALAVSARARRD